MPRTLADLDWPARTERLVLRPATADDAEATWRFRRLPEVARWIGWEAAELEEYRARYCEPARLATTLVVEHENAVVGDLMVRVEDGWSQAEVVEQAKAVQAELGWTLDPDHGGRGLATEAVREAVRLCFEELGLRRVTAECFADNDASWRLMERIGMRREVHAVAQSLHRTGAWLDAYGYALLADEWRRTAGSPVGGPV
jgi:RimJ/RimL family protein N-acetyltransferase